MRTQTRYDTSEFEKSLRKLDRTLDKILLGAMDESVSQLKEESQKLAPFKTGDLQNSPTTDVKQSGDVTTGSVQYNVEYAARQHNDLSLNPGPGTEAKSPTKYGVPGPNYLQNPAKGLGTDGTYKKNVEREWRKQTG